MKNRWLIFAAIILAFTLASSGAYNGLVNSREEALVKAEDIDLHIKEMSSLVKRSIDPVSIYAEYETDKNSSLLKTWHRFFIKLRFYIQLFFLYHLIHSCIPCSRS